MSAWLPLVAGILVLASLPLALVRVALQLLPPAAASRLAAATEGRLASRLTEYRSNPSSLLNPLLLSTQTLLMALGVLTTAAFFEQRSSSPILISLAALSALMLLFNHVLPAIVARQQPEKIIKTLLPPILLLSAALGPLGRLLAWLVVGRQPAPRELSQEERQEELQALVTLGREAGLLTIDEGALVERLLDVGETVLKEVMTPRVDMVCVRSTETLKDLADRFVKEGCARMPVYVDQLDDIAGFVHVKDVLHQMRNKNKEGATAAELMKPIMFEPESKRALQTLRALQAAHRQMAICIDEYGSVSGLVTVEDLLEEIVGEIHDEYDEEPLLVRKQGTGCWIISGKTPIELLEEQVGLSVIDDESFETISGLLLFLFGRIPETTEWIDYQGYRFEVLEADLRRIHQIRVRRLSPPKA